MTHFRFWKLFGSQNDITEKYLITSVMRVLLITSLSIWLPLGKCHWTVEILKAFSYSPNSADVFFFKKSNNFFTEQSSYSINFFTNFIFKIASWPFFWQNCTDDPLMIRWIDNSKRELSFQPKGNNKCNQLTIFQLLFVFF